MVSRRYFLEVCGAACSNRTPSVEVTSTNFAGITGVTWFPLLPATTLRAMLRKTAAARHNPTILSDSRRTLLLVLVHSLIMLGWRRGLSNRGESTLRISHS